MCNQRKIYNYLINDDYHDRDTFFKFSLAFKKDISETPKKFKVDILTDTEYISDHEIKYKITYNPYLPKKKLYIDNDNSKFNKNEFINQLPFNLGYMNDNLFCQRFGGGIWDSAKINICDVDKEYITGEYIIETNLIPQNLKPI